MPDYTIIRNLDERSVNTAMELVVDRRSATGAVRELIAQGYTARIVNPHDLDRFTSVTFDVDRLDPEATSILSKYGLRVER